MSWQNWSGRNKAPDARLVHLRSEADAAAIVRSTSGPIRTAGSGHSHAPLVVTDGIVADISALTGVLSTDLDTNRATVWAGTPIYALGRPLQDAGLALRNQGDIDRQTIAGATATGTHGTGRTLQNLTASVTALTLIDGRGELRTLSDSEEPDLFAAARLHLGAFGIVTRLQLACSPAYRLRERAWQASYAEVVEQLEQLPQRHRHFEFFWYPTRDAATVKTIDVTEDPAEYPLAEEGARCAWSHEVLPNHRPHPHTEMEYSVPAEQGPAALAELHTLLTTEFKEVAWPVEYRTLAADDVWLSTAYERDTVTISVHLDVRDDETAYYHACEEIFTSYGGRPHWGKVNYLTGEQLQERHPQWDAWWAARDSLDPDDRFLNDYLASIRTR